MNNHLIKADRGKLEECQDLLQHLLADYEDVISTELAKQATETLDAINKTLYSDFIILLDECYDDPWVCTECGCIHDIISGYQGDEKPEKCMECGHTDFQLDEPCSFLK